MKALSVRQPWASLIASGQKTIETRMWRTHHRGDILICASQSPHRGLPTGVAICIVELVDVRSMTETDWPGACCAPYPRALGWVIRNIRPVEPVPVTGKQLLFDVDFVRLLEQYRTRSHLPFAQAR